MNRGSPRPPRGFFTPNNRQQPNQDDQRNTVNIPFYRDTSSRDNYNRNFGGPSPRHFQPNHNNFHQRRGGGPRFHNNNNSYTPRNNRPNFQQGGGGRGRVSHCCRFCFHIKLRINLFLFPDHRRPSTSHNSTTLRCCRIRGQVWVMTESRTESDSGERLHWVHPHKRRVENKTKVSWSEGHSFNPSSSPSMFDQVYLAIHTITNISICICLYSVRDVL